MSKILETSLMTSKQHTQQQFERISTLMEKITAQEFNKKYRYYERVSSVTQEFDITDASQILNDEAPEGDLKETFYDVAESLYVLETTDGDELISDEQPYRIVDYIRDVLKLEII